MNAAFTAEMRNATPVDADHRATTIATIAPKSALPLLDRAMFFPTPDYLLKVKGDSMIEDGIFDGDLIAVHRTPVAENGQIVVARVDGEITVKRFQRDSRRIMALLDLSSAAGEPAREAAAHACRVVRALLGVAAEGEVVVPAEDGELLGVQVVPQVVVAPGSGHVSPLAVCPCDAFEQFRGYRRECRPEQRLRVHRG